MLADKLPDTANLALGALTFGQFLGSTFSPVVLALGFALWVSFMGFAAYFADDTTR